MWKKAAYVAALFIVGAATGTVVSVSVTKEMMAHPPRPHDMSQQMLRSLHSRLDLTPAQMQKVDPLIEKTGVELQSIYEDTRKKAGTVMDNCYSQISAVLTPEQKAKLEEIQSERRHFPPQGGGPQGGGGPHDPRHRWHPHGENEKGPYPPPPRSSAPSGPAAPAPTEPVPVPPSNPPVQPAAAGTT